MTYLKKLIIEKFRGLKNVEIEFGTRITLICGKNGTSKSSILGIAAQIFSFEKDYKSGELLKGYNTITGMPFKSRFSDHFRLSKVFDPAGSMKVKVELYDGYTAQEAGGELDISKRGAEQIRSVVRNNSAVEKGENTSRNFTHPVIYLSLKRLTPIANRDYRKANFDYLDENKQKFINLIKTLLGKRISLVTGTTGTIHSAVAHGDNYDQDSVSAGEDNAGQIALALMSFRKLKEKYAGYKGGLLLIDEADAGLFPAAQTALLSLLVKESKELDLQIIMTSHSPTLIQDAFERSQKDKSKINTIKTIYLNNNYGGIQVMNDWSWVNIKSNLHRELIKLDKDILLPKINIYFEDGEAYDLFKNVMNLNKLNKFLKQYKETSLGCNEYIRLAKNKIPEFFLKSIICLDGDVSDKDIKGLGSIVRLPGNLPPDQLIFEYLYNLPEDHVIWKNKIQFDRDVLDEIATSVISRLNLPNKKVDLKEYLEIDRKKESKKMNIQKLNKADCRHILEAIKQSDSKKEEYLDLRKIINIYNNQPIRELFKLFYQDARFQTFLSIPKNPWYFWVNENKSICDHFIKLFSDRLRVVFRDSCHVEEDKLSILFDEKINKNLLKR